MTMQEAKQTLKSVGVTITRNPALAEYKVNLKEGTEASAYYTNDRQDAVKTGLAMGQLTNLQRRVILGHLRD